MPNLTTSTGRVQAAITAARTAYRTGAPGGFDAGIELFDALREANPGAEVHVIKTAAVRLVQQHA